MRLPLSDWRRVLQAVLADRVAERVVGNYIAGNDYSTLSRIASENARDSMFSGLFKG